MQPHTESPVVSQTVETPTETASETKLAQEIAQLWSVHSQAESVLGRTKKELRALRFDLGRPLYEMKLLLACPGRAGKWSKFLSAQRIPRASADRYTKSYEVTLSPREEIASSEATADSAGGSCRRLCAERCRSLVRSSRTKRRPINSCARWCSVARRYTSRSRNWASPFLNRPRATCTPGRSPLRRKTPERK